MAEEPLCYDFDGAIEMILANRRKAAAVTREEHEAFWLKTQEEFDRLPTERPDTAEHFREINATFDKLDACFHRMIDRCNTMIEASIENRAIIARIEATFERMYGKLPEDGIRD